MAVKRLKLQRVRGHFVALKTPSETTGKYGMRVVLPSGHPQHKEVAKAFAAVAQEAFGTTNNIRFSLKNADHEDIDYDKSPELRDAYFFGCNTKARPGIVNRQAVPATDEEIDELAYSGGEYHVVVNIASYDFQGRGVTAYLSNVMLLGGGERIGRGPSAEEDFADLAENTPAVAAVGTEKDEDDVPF